MTTLPDGSRPRAMVPPNERWLAMLHAGMVRMRVPVRDCVLAGGRLVLTLGAAREGALRLIVEPPHRDRTHFRLIGGERWALSYRGRPTLGPDDERAMEILSAILAKLGDRIGSLSGYAAIVTEESDPDETLTKMFPFVSIERSAGPSGDTVEVLARTTSRCDHACPFCSAPALEEPDGAVVVACIKETAALMPGATFSLTGGEPTLKQSFSDELRAALREPGIGQVQVQTNAVGFATRLDPRSFEPTPRLSFFVSLHGSSPDVFDGCTGTRGRLSGALSGIERIARAGHRLTLNTVICAINVDHLERIAADLPKPEGAGAVQWHLSALICPESNPEAAEHLVRYSELVPRVLRATRIAEQRGIEVSSLLSSTHAALPPCVLPTAEAGDRRWLVDEAASWGVDDKEDIAEARRELSSDRIKADVCETCSEYRRCPGVPKAYGLRFGLSELRPIRSRGQDDSPDQGGN